MIESLLVVIVFGGALLYDVAYKNGHRRGTVLGFRTAATLLAEQVKENKE